MIECVVNVSEGRRTEVIDAIAAAAGRDLLDVHADAHHHRTVLTVVGETAPRAMAAVAVDRIDVRRHAGAHPRLGAVDVVPFVALDGSTPADAVAARDRFVDWAGAELGLPCVVYGGGAPTLVEVRRTAVRSTRPHPTAGAVAVGVRPPLVAYNLWLADDDLVLARSIAQRVRGPAVRALGLRVGSDVQVSMNLLDPGVVGPSAVYDAVTGLAPVSRAELVGLAPAAVVEAVDRDRWGQLDLSPDRTIEARLGSRPGSG